MKLIECFKLCTLAISQTFFGKVHCTSGPVIFTDNDTTQFMLLKYQQCVNLS